MSNPKVLVVHFAIGIDIIGSKTSLHNSKYDIEATAIGICATSRSTNRIIVVPYSNVKGFELVPEGGLQNIKAPAQQRAEAAMAEARADMTRRGEEFVDLHADDAEKAPVLSEAEQKAQADAARKAGVAKRKETARLALLAENEKTARLQAQAQQGR